MPSSVREYSSRPRLSRRAIVLLDEPTRSEEHTSELQSHLNLVCRLLLEKKKKDSKTEKAALLRKSTELVVLCAGTNEVARNHSYVEMIIRTTRLKPTQRGHKIARMTMI